MDCTRDPSPHGKWTKKIFSYQKGHTQALITSSQ
jgi:hypothetical protein